MKNVKRRRLIVLVAMCALLALILAMGGTTFAKYITSTEVDTAEATVAKWGFVVSTDADELWGAEYQLDSGKDLATVTSTSGNVVVSATGNTVAPGTTGKLLFSVVGEAEVKANVTIDFDYDDVYFTDGTNTYAPIVWKLYCGATSYSTDAADLKATGLDEIDTYLTVNADIAAGDAFAKAGYYTLTWEWAFEKAGNAPVENLATVEGAGDPADYLTNNQADTVLGYLADGELAEVNDGYEADYNVDAMIDLSIVVSQIQ